jgi:hypothetical protein
MCRGSVSGRIAFAPIAIIVVIVFVAFQRGRIAFAPTSMIVVDEIHCTAKRQMNRDIRASILR